MVGARGVRLAVRFGGALLAGLLLAGRAGAAEPVALTFDDLPALSLTDSTAYVRTTTLRLLKGLRRHHTPAIGFVVGDKLEERPADRAALLDLWLKAGFELGNHTYSHESLNRMSAAAYSDDIAQDDALLRPLLAAHHRKLRWFRYPYLETGATAADKQAVQRWLADHGYAIAPVTIENSDDQFALPYDEAILKGDAARAAEIRRSYLAYTEATVEWYRKASLQLLGRRPGLVFLVHATRLNADVLDDFLAILRRNDLKPAPLARVMRDSAYTIADTYDGPDGDDWLNRWALTLKKDLPWDSFPEPPADIVAANARLDLNP